MRKEEVRTERDIREFLKDWSDFETDVYVETHRIPFGKVSTYGRVAKRIGRPKATRAVANALHKNPLWPTVPCHRVVCSDGRFGGPKDHADGRMGHVSEEGVPVKDREVVMSDEVVY